MECISPIVPLSSIVKERLCWLGSWDGTISPSQRSQRAFLSAPSAGLNPSLVGNQSSLSKLDLALGYGVVAQLKVEGSRGASPPFLALLASRWMVLACG